MTIFGNNIQPTTLGIPKTCLLALALTLGGFGCAEGPDDGEANVIDLGAVGGKADGLLDMPIEPLGAGDETVIRFTTREAMDISVVRHTGISVALTVTSTA